MDRRGSENLVVAHLSCLKQQEEDPEDKIKEVFSDETLFEIKLPLRYADYVNYLASSTIPAEYSSQLNKKFFNNLKYNFRMIHFFIDEVLIKSFAVKC